MIILAGYGRIEVGGPMTESQDSWMEEGNIIDDIKIGINDSHVSPY